MTQPTKNFPVLDSSQILHNLQTRSNPFWPQYYAYFSTWLGGITKDPHWMVLPMDDHMVHRGDGVFEALKSVDGKVFLMKEHLQRLASSAQSIGIQLPFSLDEMGDLILQTLAVAGQKDTLIRLFVSRGPGGFTTNPYDSLGSQMYIAITKLSVLRPEAYEQGVRVGRSFIPVKESWLAQVKSCNYLPNVMMKKEAVDRGLDFTIGFDRDQCIAESSTENIAIVDESGILTHPPFENILRGTTMVKTFSLAKNAGIRTAIRSLREEDLIRAQEVMMIGTTLDVLPVIEYENRKIGTGQVGPRARQLLELLRQEVRRT
jgi:branched-subunit amino acid aminotransferase/4-amino-4-deoxychorismate lyase